MLPTTRTQQLRAQPAVPCRSCGGAVLFRTAASSAATMILNADPDDRRGTVELVGRKGCRVLTGDTLVMARRIGTPLHLDHHATCPQAAEWRRRRAGT
jgi:hypothetical protein